MRDHLRLIHSAIAVGAAVSHYLQRLANRGRSANTLAAYRSDLGQFAGYVQRRGEGELVATLTHRHVHGWLDTLSAEGVSLRSQARKLAVLRGFVKHCRVEGWLGHDPTSDVRVTFRAHRVKAPELAELMRMVDAIPRTGRNELRDRALLRLALDTGLRISEVAQLDIPGAGSDSTVDLPRGLAHVIAKGGHVHTAPFNERTRRMLEDWLRIRSYAAQPGERALFVSQRGGRLSRQGLHMVCKKRGEAVGLAGLHLHLLRHRRIGHLYEACGKEIAQAVAGHASGSTTEQVYGAHANGVVMHLVRERADLDQAVAREQGRAVA